MSDRKSSSGIACLALALGAGWSTLALVTIEASREDNALRGSRDRARHVALLAPQGWGFFTRDPREDDFDVLAHDGQRWRTLFEHPNFRWAHALGWSRSARAQAVEFGLLSAELDMDGWTPCEADVDGCIAGLETRQVLTNPSPRPTLCGDVVVVTHPPVPWAWARSARGVTMPSKLMRVSIEC